ncbi:MAG: hypothetical protein QXP71_02690 [Desulfurococcaceae archaeon]
MYKKPILLILLIILNIQYLFPFNTPVSLTNYDLTPGRLVKIWETTSSSRVKNYFLSTCSSRFVIAYTTGLNTHVYLDDKYFNTITLGDTYYYVIDNNLLLISIYRSKRIDYILIDCSIRNIILNKTIEYSTPIILFNKPLSIYYEKNTKIDIYIAGESYTGEKYTAILRHDLLRNELDIVSIINRTIYYGNIVPYIDRVIKTPVYTVLSNPILIENVYGLINIVIGNNQYVTDGLLLQDNPVKLVDNTIIVELNTSTYYKLVLFKNSVFKELRIQNNYDTYSLSRIHYSYNSILTIYTSNINRLIKYIDLDNNTEELIIYTVSNKLPFNTYIDFDSDDHVDIITYLNNSFYLYLTNSNWIRIYWDYLYDYLETSSLFNILLFNNTIYIIMCFYRNQDYVIQLVKYVTGIELDNTPPYIEVRNPVDNGVYLEKVLLDIICYDNESGIYLTKILLMRGDNIVFSENNTSEHYYREISLDQGQYLLKIESWNNDGVYNSREVLFTILNYDIFILKPQNYSYVSHKLELEIVSSYNFTLLIIIDSVLNNSFNISTGFNNIVIDISNIVDKTIKVDVIVVETNNVYEIIVFKDTTPPELIVNGLENYTVVFYSINFTLTVIETNPNITSIYLNNTLLYTFETNGTFTCILSSIDLKPGYYFLTIVSIDRAGNSKTIIYIVYIGEVGDPVIVIKPEPFNNTFVSGILFFTIECFNTSRLEVYVNNTLYYSIDINKTVYSVNISFNTVDWIDGVYIIVFKAIGYNDKILTVEYTWYVDNKYPYLNIIVPLIGLEWRNNSFIPVRDPFLNITYIYSINGYYCLKLYLNISDRWLSQARLYLNNTIAQIYDPYSNTIREAVFYESKGYFTYVVIPGEGYYILKLEAFDKGDHFSEYIIGFRIDLYPPQVLIHEPLNNTITNNRLLNLTISIYDSTSRLAEIAIAVISGEYRSIPLNEYSLLALIRVNNTYTFKLPEIRSVDGKYCLSILVLDQGFNYVISNIYVVIDTKPPFIKYNYSIVDSVLNIEVEFIDELTGFSHAYLTIVNKTMIQINSSKTFHTFELDIGNYTVVIEAWDIAGNMNKTVFTIDIKPSKIENRSSATITGETNELNNRLLIGLVTLIALSVVILSVLIIKKRKNSFKK